MQWLISGHPAALRASITLSLLLTGSLLVLSLLWLFLYDKRENKDRVKLTKYEIIVFIIRPIAARYAIKYSNMSVRN